uniref:Ribosomal_L18A domain-containing protein n=2 Tax=Bursaphelenchus xylophilus TaxID=6326 RepID=A0A1I7SNT8_BURXY
MIIWHVRNICELSEYKTTLYVKVGVTTSAWRTAIKTMLGLAFDNVNIKNTYEMVKIRFQHKTTTVVIDIFYATPVSYGYNDI